MSAVDPLKKAGGPPAGIESVLEAGGSSRVESIDEDAAATRACQNSIPRTSRSRPF
jgi:hypothetical protein